MIIAGLQAGPNGAGGPGGQDKQETDPKFFAPPAFLQPPGQEHQQTAAEKEKQQKAAEAAAAVLSKKNIQPEADNKSNKDRSRPVSSTPVPGTPWCVVWTGDSKSFFYNPRF